MSCFADCGSECLVMRVPYQVAVKMLEGLPNGADKDELRKRMEIAARRSKKFTELMEAVNNAD